MMKNKKWATHSALYFLFSAQKRNMRLIIWLRIDLISRLFVIVEGFKDQCLVLSLLTGCCDIERVIQSNKKIDNF